MKKSILIIGVLALMFAFVGCGKKNENNNYEGKNDVAEETELDTPESNIHALEGMWEYRDENGKVYSMQVLVKDDEVAMVIVKEALDLPMWTFNDCVYDAATGILSAEKSDATVIEAEGEAKIYDASKTTFTFKDDTCIWSDAEANFGMNVSFKPQAK